MTEASKFNLLHNWIARYIQMLNFGDIVILDQEQLRDVILEMRRNFATGKIIGPPEGLDFETSILHPESWQWVTDFTLSVEAIYFVDDNFRYGIQCKNGEIFGKFLRQLRRARLGFRTFFVFDSQYQFLSHFDHEDCLYAAGTAVQWLNNLLSKSEELTGIAVNMLSVNNIEVLDLGKRIVITVGSETTFKETRLEFLDCRAMRFLQQGIKTHDEKVRLLVLAIQNEDMRGKSHKQAFLKVASLDLQIDYENLRVTQIDTRN